MDVNEKKVRQRPINDLGFNEPTAQFWAMSDAHYGEALYETGYHLRQGTRRGAQVVHNHRSNVEFCNDKCVILEVEA